MQRIEKLVKYPTLNEALAGKYIPCSKDAPDLISCNAGAVAIIADERPPVYQKPRLKEGRGRSERTATGSKNADNEFERRNEARKQYEKLSRYYLLEGPDQEQWEREKLLLKGKHGQSLNMQKTFRSPNSPQCWMSSSTSPLARLSRSHLARHQLELRRRRRSFRMTCKMPGPFSLES